MGYLNLALIKNLLIILVLYIVFKIIMLLIIRLLLKKTRTKKQASNIQIFSRLIGYIILITLILFIISSYSGAWVQLGLGVGLFSAALGWALQKPITGIAAWVMMVFKRPFEIGDRIIINNVRGDVIDIDLTHIKIKEIGGIVPGEENSGRTILVPNSVLFESNVINYTYASNSYILDEINFTITYDSNLEKAKRIAVGSAKNILSKILGRNENSPYTLAYFDASGMKISLRYFAPANNLQKFSSDISQAVFKKLKKQSDIQIAYPHQQILVKHN